MGEQAVGSNYRIEIPVQIVERFNGRSKMILDVNRHPIGAYREIITWDDQRQGEYRDRVKPFYLVMHSHKAFRTKEGARKEILNRFMEMVANGSALAELAYLCNESALARVDEGVLDA